MSSYVLNQQQIADLSKVLGARAPYIADLIAKAVAANAVHNRGATVTLAIKIARNTDDARIIEIEAQEKTKQPRSKFSDVTSWDEPMVLVAYRTDQDPGQQTIEITVGKDT